MVTVNPEDLNSLPVPHQWATYTSFRSSKYKTHATLGHVKNALSGTVHRDAFQCDTYVFAWNDQAGQWEQYTKILKGTLKADVPLFQRVVPNKRESKPPPQAAIDKALRSIQQSIDASSSTQD